MSVMRNGGKPILLCRDSVSPFNSFLRTFLVLYREILHSTIHLQRKTMEKYFKLQSIKHTKREVSFIPQSVLLSVIWFSQKNHNKITSERTLLFTEKSILTIKETTIRNEIWKYAIFTHQFTNNFCQIFILNLQTNKNMTFNCTRIKHSHPFQRRHCFSLFNHPLYWVKKREKYLRRDFLFNQSCNRSITFLSLKSFYWEISQRKKLWLFQKENKTRLQTTQ